MKKRFMFILLLSVQASAQQAVDLIRADEARARIFFLAADEMAGRGTASQEARIAANYVASEFMRLGLKPIGDNDTYFQTFDLVKAQLDTEKTTLKARIDGLEKTYQIGHDFFFWCCQSGSPSEVSGPLAFLGYGVNAPEYGYNDFADLSLNGKVAMVLNHEPQEFDPHSRFKGNWNTVHAYNWLKMERVRKSGAAGLLIVDERKPHRLPRIPSAPTDTEAGVWPQIAVAGRRWDLPVFRISWEVADELLAGTGQTIEDLQKAIDHSFKPHSFEVPGVKVKMIKALKDRRVSQGRNVLGLLEGADTNRKNEFVLITAHYDHVGAVGGRIYRGADDNASGTIGVLEIARAYVRGRVRPKRSLLFLVFDAEERGLLGSFYYLDHPVVPLEKTVSDLNMDMIGRDEESATWHTTAEQNQNSVNVVGTLYNPEIRYIIENCNKTIGLKLDFKTDAVDPEEWFMRSDHFPFATKSIPIVLFNTGENPDYHTENDKWERIDYPKLEKILRLVFLTSVAIADSDRRIDFTP